MKNLHIYLFLISLFIAFSSNAVVITGDLTAVYGTSLPPNTYQVPMWSNIYIPTGSSFTIEPGVIIEFDYNSQMFTEPGSNLVILENTEFQMKEDTRFIIKGDLFIHGTSSGPARFYEHPANIGACWGGIIIDSCTIDTIFIDYAHIQDVEKFSFGLPLSDLAGAIFVNNSTFNVFEIRNSTIRNNFTKLMGAGICFNFSSCSNPVIIENNRFLDNRCRSKGGAIYINSLLTTKFKIFKNEFSKNRARNGGAIFLEDAIFGGIDLVKNHFVKNQARDNGGACFFRGDVVNIEIIENEFNSNRAVNFDGGGIYFSNFYHNSPMIILFNIFDSNKARDGGAVCSKHEKGSDKEYLNNLFMYNSAGDEGGAIYCEANYNFVNNTIVCNNSGISTGGIYAASTIVGSYGILNNILWDNAPAQVNALLSVLNTYPLFDYNDIDYVGAPAGTNINSNPQFIDPVMKNFRLQSTSPCFDAGDPIFTPAYYYTFWNDDLDFSLRIKSSYVDMGAYELWTSKSAEFQNPEFDLQGKISVYPNPANSILNIDLEEIEGSKIGIKLYNIQGQLIRDFLPGNSAFEKRHYIFNVNSLENGMYILKIDLENQSWTQKIIIE